MSAAWIAVVASLGGVAVGGMLNLLDNHLRSRREDRLHVSQRSSEVEERWRQACVSLASLADEVWSRSWSFVDYRLADEDGWRTDPYVQTQQETLESVLSRLTSAYNELRVLGMLSFGDEAHKLLEVAFDASNVAFGESPTHPSDDLISPAAGDFLDAVSHEFALTRPGKD